MRAQALAVGDDGAMWARAPEPLPSPRPAVWTEQALRVGELLTDPRRDTQYRIVRLIGRGGMGEVYEVEQIDNGHHLAVKCMRLAQVTSPLSLQRARMEGTVLERLRNRHVVPVYAMGVRDDGLIWMLMPLLVGHTLTQALKVLGRLPIPWALEIARDVCLGLEAIHAFAVHRDIKPCNIHIDQEARVRVLDLGAGKFNVHGLATTGGFTIGTLNYMSPEQLLDPQKIDHRSDLFSVGVVLYELLTGRNPFVDEGAGTAGSEPDTKAVGTAIIFRDPRPFDDVASWVPHTVRAITLKFLAKEREDRFESATAAVEALDAALRRHQDTVLSAPLRMLCAELTLRSPQPQGDAPPHAQGGTTLMAVRGGTTLMAVRGGTSVMAPAQMAADGSEADRAAPAKVLGSPERTPASAPELAPTEQVPLADLRPEPAPPVTLKVPCFEAPEASHEASPTEEATEPDQAPVRAEPNDGPISEHRDNAVDEAPPAAEEADDASEEASSEDEPSKDQPAAEALEESPGAASTGVLAQAQEPRIIVRAPDLHARSAAGVRALARHLSRFAGNRWVRLGLAVWVSVWLVAELVVAGLYAGGWAPSGAASDHAGAGSVTPIDPTSPAASPAAPLNAAGAAPLGSVAQEETAGPTVSAASTPPAPRPKPPRIFGSDSGEPPRPKRKRGVPALPGGDKPEF